MASETNNPKRREELQKDLDLFRDFLEEVEEVQSKFDGERDEYYELELTGEEIAIILSAFKGQARQFRQVVEEHMEEDDLVEAEKRAKGGKVTVQILDDVRRHLDAKEK